MGNTIRGSTARCEGNLVDSCDLSIGLEMKRGRLDVGNLKMEEREFQRKKVK